MDAFFDRPQYIKHFPSGEDSFVCTVGYDNFLFVKPLHAYRLQSFYTWHFVLSGSGVLDIDGREFVARQGQMFFIPPGVKMRYYPQTQDPWEYVWFSLVGDMAAKYGALMGYSVEEPVKTMRFYSGVKTRLKRLFQSLTVDEGGIFSAMSAFYGILELCTSDAVVTGIHAVKKYIDESFALPGFSIEQLCYDAGFSHAHLLRLFRKAYGTTLIKYVINKRVMLACELLTTTDLSVKSVAFSCGFSDEPHFMKTFKQAMGVSALQYRRQNMK